MSNQSNLSRKVFVILIALDFTNYDHYYMHPTIYYESKEEAQLQADRLIATKIFEASQVKVESLWLVKVPTPVSLN